MIASTPFYHETIRKVTIAFGSIFSSIKIQRREKSGDKDIMQTVMVPIALGSKDKWVQRTESDPSLENQTYNVLPRMAYEMQSIEYDPMRKLSKLNRVVCRTETSGDSLFSPVPYNMEFNLYLAAKTQEDCYQMVEQIIPYFSPELTLSINLIPGFNIVQDIPVILNSISIDDDYEGDFQTRRTVIATLNFTLKTNFYGPSNTGGIIKKVVVTFPTPINGEYVATQATPISPIIETFSY